jgi:hypothetical protein
MTARFGGTPVEGAPSKPRFAGTAVEPESRASQVFRAFASKATQNPAAAVHEVEAQHARDDYDKLPWYAKPIQAAADIGNVMGDAVTMGYGDKAAALTRSTLGIGGGDYEQELAKLRGQTEGAYARSGSAAIPAEIGSMIAAAPELGAAKGLRYVGKPLEALMERFLGRAAVAGAEGAAYGAGSASGHDEDILTGAGLGAAFGVGGSAIADGVATLGRTAKDLFAEPAQRAQAAIFDAAKKAKITPDVVKKWLADHGDELMTADVLGKEGSSLGRAVSNLESGLSGRKAGQNERVVQTVEEAAGVQPGGRRTVDAIKADEYASRKGAIDQAYTDARKAGYDLPRGPFEEVLGSPLGARAYSQAETSLKNRVATEGIDAASELARLDQTQRELGDIATSALRTGNNDLAAQAKALQAKLKDAMDKGIAGPEYTAARSARKEAGDAERAVEAGQTLAKPRIKLDAPGKAAETAPAHKPLMARGYAAQQAEQLLNKGSTEGALGAMSTPMAKQAAAAALGEEGASKVGKRLGTERVFNATNRDIVGGSTTARQLAEMIGSSTLGAGAGFFSGAVDPYTGGVLGAALKVRGVSRALGERLAMRSFTNASPDIARRLISSPREIPTERGIDPSMLEAWRDTLAKLIGRTGQATDVRGLGQ